MKKVININFQGRVIPIEESAYDILKQYVESLRRYFANEEGRDEIINDIEGRVAELFGEILKKGATCITDDDVNKIIDSMGRPEDFDGEEASVKQQLGGEQKQQQSSSSNYAYQQQSFTQTDGPRRLYRDESHKVLGGVCSGLGNYFGVDKMVIRILAILFFGIMFIPYLIVWIAVPSSATQVIGSRRKRLFRDGEDKIIAGVCSGLSSYFGVSVWVPRLLFLIPFFSFVFRFGHWSLWNFPHFLSMSFSPGSIFAYVILWLVLPEAKTTADKLEMKGEKVDLNNIKNTIQNDMEGFGQRAKKFGEELGERAAAIGQNIGVKGAEMGREAATLTKKSRNSLGDIIVWVFKAFAYFIIGCFIFSIVSGLFAAGVALTGLMPAWSYIIADGWQNIFAWGTLILFIWVPVIGIVTFIIRRLSKRKGNSGIIRYSFLSLWLIGLFCFISLLVSISREFKSKSNLAPETIALSNAGINKLDIKVSNADYDEEENWLKLTPFASFVGDTLYVPNIKIRIIKSTSDSFQVGVIKFSRGKNRSNANELASKIYYNVVQTDSVLNLAKGIAINQTDKFRNQHVWVTVAVPVGKKFMIRESDNHRSHVRVDFGSDDYEWNWYEWSDGDHTKSISTNVEYILTQNGLERTNKKNVREDSEEDDSNNAVDKYKSKEDLQRQYEEAEKEAVEKKRKADEIKKELDRPIIDSTRYKYTPEKPKKTELPKTKSTAQTETRLGMSDLLMMKFFI